MSSIIQKYRRLCVSAALLLGFATHNQAALTDLADAPLAVSASTQVKPNLMFLLDDSGSMGQDFTPDYVYGSMCYDAKDTGSPGVLSNILRPCFPGDPPFMSPDFNAQYYNPDTYYEPPVTATGASMGNQSPTAARADPYLGIGADMVQKPAWATNLTTSWPDRAWCANSSGSAGCVINSTSYQYPDNSYGYGFNRTSKCTNYSAAVYGSPTNCINIVYGAPYYWRINPGEYCTNDELTTCSSTVTAFPSTLRWCSDETLTDCQARYAPATGGGGGYVYPRHIGARSGTTRSNTYPMTRVDIVPGRTFPKTAGRIDCVAAAGVCTYAEEIQNFANWYSYYRTRLNAMKSAASLAFKPIDSHFRVGYRAISYPQNCSGSTCYLDVQDFDQTQKTAWYYRLHQANLVGSTPLRRALQQVGDYYAHKDPNAVDPIQYSCQQNFTLLTTDGWWNDSISIGNQDNDPSDGISTRASGRYDGGLSGATNTLADVAMYYYKTDLRPTMTNNVFTSKADPANWQHMTTFTLGLGVDGAMKYRGDYDTATTGDFYKIKSGSSTCSWGSPCNWPVPVSNTQTTVDDLWHAAVNGHGKYFSARDPAQLVSGLKSALSNIQATVGSSAASATSSPNITAADNWIYLTTFTADATNSDWSGEIVGKQIDPVTGQIPTQTQPTDWAGAALIQARVAANSDSRTIYTFDSAGNAKTFDWTSLSATEQSYLSGKGSMLSQYGGLSSAQRTTLNDGAAMLGYLRGQTNGVGSIYRSRQTALGDIVHGRPAYVRIPLSDYTDAGFAAHKTSLQSRVGAAYVGANDGMIHAFNGTSGAENWAYVPRMLMPSLYQLAEFNYGNLHKFFVDGDSIVEDIKSSGGAWKTVLITGMGKGARGFVALDVTNPSAPAPLWEFCHDSTLCAVNDSDLGYTFGNPIITKRASDGKWVALVTSGYNNTTPGSGQGYLYVLDVESGAILSKVSTGSGSTTTPSGLSKINAWVVSPQYDNTTSYVYGGDLNGDLWRFDLTTNAVSVLKIGTLKNASNQIQPVTVKPELLECDGLPMVLLGTGKMLGATDLGNNDIQSIYGVFDRGTSYGSGSLRNSPLQQQTTTTDASGNVSVSNAAVSASSVNGWYVDLSAGERVNVDPALGLGTLVIAGNIPQSGNACVSGGSSVTYQLAACNGGVIDPQQTQQGIKDPNALVAGLTMYQMAVNGRVFVDRSKSDGKHAQDPVWISGSTQGGRRVQWTELMH